jgi:hypothetical protein
MANQLLYDIEGNMNPITFRVDITTPDRGTISLNVAGIQEFYIIEDLEQTFRTGRVRFKDVDYLHEYLPFTGNETMEIEIRQGSSRKIVKFDIFKVERIEGDTQGQLVEWFDLLLIESGWYEMMTYKPGDSFKDKKSSEIIFNLLKNYTQIENINIIENTTTTYDLFVMPVTWTIMNTVQYLLSRSISENGGWGWVTWIDGGTKRQFNIQTIENIISTSKNKSDPDGFLFFRSSVPYSTEMILSFTMHPIDKFMLTRRLGGGKYYGTDRNTKTLSIYKTDLQKEIEKIELMGPKALFTEDRKYDSAYIELRSWAYGSHFPANYHRNAFIKDYFNQMQVDVSTYGRVDRKLGQVLDIRWLSKVTPNSEEGQKNPYNDALKGRWLIKGITHYYRSDEEGLTYINKMVLARNAYGKIPYSTLIDKKV